MPAPERATSALFRVGFWLPLAICLWIALSPAPPGALFRLGDLLPHFAAFAYLTVALRLAWPRLGHLSAILWMCLLGAAIELLQAAGGKRVADWRDFAADLAGIAAGLAVHRLAGARVRRIVDRLVTAWVG
ncbi:MAG: VanZ family protein [Pseudomonadales bacterium]|nr:VanZ family protein [Pseudomonadales bacterium]